MSDSAVLFDHVVILVPYQIVVNPPSWITDNFKVSPGGRHGDGKTENRLVLLGDGTYLELIAFVDDNAEHRHGHFWDKSFGVIDYALTSASPYDFDALRKRLDAGGSGVSYAEPKDGSRLRPDGVRLKWQVFIPTGAARGEVPFWCFDVTPRDLRVPVNDENTTHPSSAVGMAGMLITVDEHKADRVIKVISAIAGENKDSVGTPLGSGSANRAFIRTKRPEQPQQQYHLSVVLRTSRANPPPDIQLPIGDGLVSIKFEPTT